MVSLENFFNPFRKAIFKLRSMYFNNEKSSFFVFFILSDKDLITNKPGTAQVGAISKAQQIVKFGRKNRQCYTRNENAISELWKRYIRTLKTLYPNFANVISEL